MAGIPGWRTGPEFYFPTGPQAVARSHKSSNFLTRKIWAEGQAFGVGLDRKFSSSSKVAHAV